MARIFSGRRKTTFVETHESTYLVLINKSVEFSKILKITCKFAKSLLKRFRIYHRYGSFKTAKCTKSVIKHLFWEKWILTFSS
eukprot:TRINITY_DN8124_c0_g1_i1.p1 TRINITY_DN8124_c0_g1~~TRINITY_DN8124_c0_g1_i1.p1  ORF type:complete len:83 (-),score=4.85 TRINITY_DN8124_c0_g1_i1:26-274(-)